MNKRINRIKEVLVRKEVSQKQLAEKLGRNEHTVSNWCGNKSQPHLADLCKVAEYLDVDICELLEPTKPAK